MLYQCWRVERITLTFPKLVTSRSSVKSLSEWNVHRITNNPLIYSDALKVAVAILGRRVESLHKQLPPDQPIDLGFYAAVLRLPAILIILHSWQPATSVNREASQEVWERKLIPSLHLLRKHLQKHAHNQAMLSLQVIRVFLPPLRLAQRSCPRVGSDSSGTNSRGARPQSGVWASHRAFLDSLSQKSRRI